MAKYLTVPLNKKHKKSEFTCGNERLDNYIRTQARQDIKKKLSACFVVANEEDKIKGFYTLSNAGISRDLIPEEIKKKMPKAYDSLPVTLLGRLAVDKQYRGQGLGQSLLVDALKKSLEASNNIMGSIAVIVDPIDEDAAKFYRKYGFILLPDSGKMFLSMKTVEQLFNK